MDSQSGKIAAALALFVGAAIGGWSIAGSAQGATPCRNPIKIESLKRQLVESERRLRELKEDLAVAEDSGASWTAINKNDPELQRKRVGEHVALLDRQILAEKRRMKNLATSLAVEEARAPCDGRTLVTPRRPRIDTPALPPYRSTPDSGGGVSVGSGG